MEKGWNFVINYISRYDHQKNYFIIKKKNR